MAEAIPQDQLAGMDHAEVHYFNRYGYRISITLIRADRKQLQSSWWSLAFFMGLAEHLLTVLCHLGIHEEMLVCSPAHHMPQSASLTLS